MDNDNLHSENEFPKKKHCVECKCTFDEGKGYPYGTKDKY